VQFTLGTYTGTLSYELASSGVSLLEVSFSVSITEPDCDDLRIDLPISAPEAMSITLGSQQQDIQALPAVTDEFGLIAQGYCSYTFDIALAELTDPPFVSVEDGSLVLVTPNSPGLIQTWQAELTVHLLDSDVIVDPIEFEVEV